MKVFSSFLGNWELAAVAIVINITVVLGFIVYWADRKSATHRTFLLFLLATALWSCLNYLSFQPFPEPFALLTLRLTLFAATWFTFFFLLFSLSFPRDHIALPKMALWTLGAWNGTISLLCLTPYVLHEVTAMSANGAIVSVSNGALIPLFGMTTVGYVLGGLVLLLLNTYRADKEHKQRFIWVTTGIASMFVAVVITNFFLPVVFSNASLLPYTAIFIFPFFLLTSYSIIKHRLLDVRVAGTEVFISFLLVFNVVQLAQTSGLSAIFTQLTILIGLVVASVLLIRSVLREIEQREIIETQAKKLEVANVKQMNLLHFISHEIKGHLTKSQAAFAEIANGDMGETPGPIRTLASEALVEVRKGVDTVMDILEASNLQKGTVVFETKQFDFAAAVGEIVETLRPQAEKKGLRLHYAKPVTGAIPFIGDEEKIRRHVIRNLVDNSIKYTQSGEVTVELARTPALVRLVVRDTGIGITPEDMKNLFTEGGKGKESSTINVSSTGYGLFIAKEVVEAHKGRIWAESEGPGKGSRFVVELPASVLK